MVELGIAKPELELRASPRPAILALALLAAVLALTPGLLPRNRQVPLALLAYALGLLTWLASAWRPLAGRWLTVAALAVIARALEGWLAGAVPWSLAVVPVAAAAALINLRAAGAVALGETVLLLAGGGGVAALIPPWAVLGVMVLAYRPVYNLTEWSWEHFRLAQRLLEDARDRQVELKQALADLAEANVQLTRLNRLAQGLRLAAEEARRTKEQFVANVSHELRTPLNMIIGFSEMIVQAPRSYGDALPPALLADLEIILRNSQHLSSLIDDVLDLSQIEAGHMSLTKERVALAEIVEAATTAVRPLFETRGLYLEAQVAADLPPVFCDRTRIREVLLNLLSNAGRFTEHGGVHLRAWREGDRVTVSVADTGPGIGAEESTHLFQPFHQLDPSIRRRHGGSGLGLSISRGFVELHGGRMWFESRKGQGTTFFFQVPIDPLPPDAPGISRWFNPYAQHEERARRPQAPIPTVRPRFVVLEKGGSLQRLLARYLDNIEVVAVAEPEEAWRELARVPSQALLINEASVDQALQHLLHDSGLPYGTPALLCSIPSTAEAAGALGASDYLIKPVSPQALLEVLDRLQLKGRTVLVVDDEPDALHLFRRLLRAAGRGYRVLSAGDGRQALAILHQEPVHALLVDLSMPEMDGFQLLAAKNEDPALRSIPAAVISARDPAGQPILASALAVTRGGGLSLAQLLACIEALTRVLAPGQPTADRAPRAAPGDALACA